MIVMFRLQLIYNTARRWFSPKRIVVYDDYTLRFLESAMENIFGVDLHVPQHGHNEVQLKRFFINFLVDETEWSVTELSRNLMSAGVFAKGLSRRSLQYYVNTLDEALGSDNVSDAMQLRQEYLTFKNSLKSIL